MTTIGMIFLLSNLAVGVGVTGTTSTDETEMPSETVDSDD